MKYIPDKNLYSAVMFALRMCPSLQYAYDSKIKVAADYYHVNQLDVLAIVKQELWERAIKEAKEKGPEWYTIYNPHAMRLLGIGFGNDYVFICPQCGAHYSCNINDYFKIDKIFVSQCKCGFTDNYQRIHVRNNVFKRLYKEA
jgi:hypothetical protein